MPRSLPLPNRAPSPTAVAALGVVQELAATDADSVDAHLQLVSDLRHVAMAAEAGWEDALARAREAVRNVGALGARVVDNPTGGLDQLAVDTGLARATIQNRVTTAPARTAEARRREAFPA